MARTTLDLIRDLQAEAPKFTGLQLVVAFESSCTFISADEQGALGALNRLSKMAGNPLVSLGGLLSGRARKSSRSFWRNIAMILRPKNS
jgi:hypothetical protein